MRAEEDAMPSDLERLAFLGIDPASLDPPRRPPRVRADWLARIDSHSPDRRRCCSCTALAVATRVVDLAELGQRWHDQCRDCMIAGIRLNWAAGRPGPETARFWRAGGTSWPQRRTRPRGGSTPSGAGKGPASPWMTKQRAPG
ncbi:hypothetical protein ACFV8Z_53300 [Streptomyces sp. NPDC059837]|uniref:hypothetical protein n=1 Tax=Streptomyces sp. NPDC059837 TaxID=3346968 RepID=UPI003658277D